MSRFYVSLNKVVPAILAAVLAVAATALGVFLYLRPAPTPAPADGKVQTAAALGNSTLPRLPSESPSPQPLAPRIPGGKTDVAATDLIEKITVKIDVGPGEDLKEPVALDLGLGYPLWLYPVGRKSVDLPPRGAIPQQSTAKEKIAAGDSATFTFTTKGDPGQDPFRTSGQLLANTRVGDVARVGFACKGTANWMLAGYEVTINDKPFAAGKPNVKAGDRAASTNRWAELAGEIAPLDQVRKDKLQLLKANQLEEKDKTELLDVLRKLRPLVREKAWLEGQLAGRYLWFEDPEYKAPAAGKPTARMAKVTLVTNSHTGADTRNNVYVRIGGRKYFLSSPKRPLTYKRGPQIFNLDLLAGPLTDADLRDWAVGMLGNATPYDVAPDRWHGSRFIVEIDGDVVYDSDKRPEDRRSLNVVRLIPPAHLDKEGNLVIDREDNLQIYLWEPAKKAGLDPATGIALAPPPPGDPLAPKPEPSQSDAGGPQKPAEKPTPAAGTPFGPSADTPKPLEKPTPAADTPFDPSADTPKPPEKPTQPAVPPKDPSADTPPPLKQETPPPPGAPPVDPSKDAPPPLNPQEPAPPGVSSDDAPPPLLPGEQPVNPAPDDGGGGPPPLPDDGGGNTPPLPDDGGDTPPPLPDDGGGNIPDPQDDGGGVIPPLPDDGGGNLGNVPPIFLVVGNDNKPDNSKLEQLLADILNKLNANPAPPPPAPTPSGTAPQFGPVKITNGRIVTDKFRVQWQVTGDESEVDHYLIQMQVVDPSDSPANFTFLTIGADGKAPVGSTQIFDVVTGLDTATAPRYLVAFVTAVMKTASQVTPPPPALSAAHMVFPVNTDFNNQPLIGNEKNPHIHLGPNSRFQYHLSRLIAADDGDFDINFPGGPPGLTKVWEPGGFTSHLIGLAPFESPVNGGLHLGVRPNRVGDKIRVHLTCRKPAVKSTLVADLGFQGIGAVGSFTATITDLTWFNDTGATVPHTKIRTVLPLPASKTADALDAAGTPALTTPSPFKVAVDPSDAANATDYLVITIEFTFNGIAVTDPSPVLFGVRLIPQ